MSRRRPASGVPREGRMGSDPRAPTKSFPVILEHLIRLGGHTEDDFAVLAEFEATTRTWIDGIVAAFYDTLFAYEPSRQVFGEEERQAREETLRAWLAQVTGGGVDPYFWVHQWIVGLVHIKRRVSLVFMLSTMGLVQQLFLDKCLQELDPADTRRLYGSFKRVTDIVAGLIAEGQHQGYLQAVADVTGMKSALIDRMAEVAIDRLLKEARNNVDAPGNVAPRKNQESNY